MNRDTKKENGKTDWRSLDELAGTPEFRRFVEEEFPNHASEFLDGATRRQFLKVMAASFCLAGLVGCRWPKEKIVPYSRRPEETDPGKTKQFITAMEIGGVSTGLLSTSYDGRPIKIDGHPNHPFSQGTASAIAQAAILELYDPDRGQEPVEQTGGEKTIRTWNEAESFVKIHFSECKKREGQGFSILSESTSSLSVLDMRERLAAAFPRMKWHEYESVSRDNEREGLRIAFFGQPVRAIPQLDRAKVILSLDSDLFGTHPAALKNAADFAKGRTPQKGVMNRLYAVESRYTLAGAMADHRMPLPSSQIERFALTLLAELVLNQNVPLGPFFLILQPILSRYLDHPFDQKWLSALAKDLAANPGASFIAAGEGQPPLVHIAALILNEILGATGKTVLYSIDPDQTRPSHLEAISALAKEIDSGKVETLVILGGNPAFDAPVDLYFSNLLEKIPNTIHLSLYPNETSKRCKWYLPRAHFLESWGDARAYDGTLNFIQPLIEPLYGSKSAIELLAIILGDPLTRGYDIMRRSFQKIFSADTVERSLPYWLHNGLIDNTNTGRLGSFFDNIEIKNRIEQRLSESPISNEQYLELVFYPDTRIYDGRFANNGWLQETPDFLTQLAWDNAALIAPSTAQALGIEQGDLIRLTYKGRTLEIAAYRMPGQAPNSIAVALGYGRTAAGRIGNRVGFAANLLRTSDSLGFGVGAKIEKTDRSYSLAVTQDRFAAGPMGMRERDSRIHERIQAATLETYLADPQYFQKRSHPPEAALRKEQENGIKRWGMAIDLNTCIGCNACVVACQSENNIPVVGKTQVANGREMQWIRVDRYFCETVDSPRIVHQPVACVHCENAPCEPACPVGATMHNREGLNAMVYNRCAGKRLCSNSCPFKVRRFNFAYYHKNLRLVEEMMYNPEVTVRSRGVMEKCTYCIQRIEAAKINAKNNRREIADGEIVPACAQTCPAQAIVFGDLSDPQSRVSQLQAQNRAYTLFGELNVKPRTAYLARIRNENPELALY